MTSSGDAAVVWVQSTLVKKLTPWASAVEVARVVGRAWPAEHSGMLRFWTVPGFSVLRLRLTQSTVRATPST